MVVDAELDAEAAARRLTEQAANLLHQVGDWDEINCCALVDSQYCLLYPLVFTTASWACAAVLPSMYHCIAP